MYSLYVVYTMYSYNCEDFSLRISIDVNTKYYTKPFLKLYIITTYIILYKLYVYFAMVYIINSKKL